MQPNTIFSLLEKSPVMKWVETMAESFQYKSQIDTSVKKEVQYWTKKWNISPQQLNGAIKATGSTNIIRIEEYLNELKFRVRRPRFIKNL